MTRRNAWRPIGLAALLVLTATHQACALGWLGVRIRDLSETEMEEISARPRSTGAFR